MARMKSGKVQVARENPPSFSLQGRKILLAALPISPSPTGILTAYLETAHFDLNPTRLSPFAKCPSRLNLSRIDPFSFEPVLI